MNENINPRNIRRETGRIQLNEKEFTTEGISRQHQRKSWNQELAVTRI